MAGIQLTVDTKAVEEALSKTILNHKQIMRKTLSVVGKNQAKRFNAAIGSSVNSRSGELRKSYKYKVRVDDTVEQVTLFAKGNSSRTIYLKLMTLNYGAVIKPLKNKVLHFQSNGHWYTAYEVKVSGRHFLEMAWESYAGNGAYATDVEDMINKELKKYWG